MFSGCPTSVHMSVCIMKKQVKVSGTLLVTLCEADDMRLSKLPTDNFISISIPVLLVCP